MKILKPNVSKTQVKSLLKCSIAAAAAAAAVLTTPSLSQAENNITTPRTSFSLISEAIEGRDTCYTWLKGSLSDHYAKIKDYSNTNNITFHSKHEDHPITAGYFDENENGQMDAGAQGFLNEQDKYFDPSHGLSIPVTPLNVDKAQQSMDQINQIVLSLRDKETGLIACFKRIHPRD